MNKIQEKWLKNCGNVEKKLSSSKPESLLNQILTPGRPLTQAVHLSVRQINLQNSPKPSNKNLNNDNLRKIFKYIYLETKLNPQHVLIKCLSQQKPCENLLTLFVKEEVKFIPISKFIEKGIFCRLSFLAMGTKFIQEYFHKNL